MKKMLIGDQWVGAGDGRTLPVISPSDGQAFDEIARGSAHEVDLAVKAARASLTGAWGQLNAAERGRIMMRISQKVLDHEEELAQIEAKDTGKPLTTARNDIKVLARYFEFYAGGADKLHGETIPFLNGHQVSLIRAPLVVTAHIIPCKYPAQMLGRTVALALAMGNGTVLKPAEDTSLSAIRFAELALEAGLPHGALNIVTGLGEEVGAALSGHPGIDFVSFTGFDDVDMERAVPIIVRAIVQNAGQTCTAGSRLLVQRSIYDQFVGKVAEAFAKVRVGTPEMDFDCGPVMNPAQHKRVQRYIDQAREQGIPVLAEGQIAADAPAGGYFVKPTLFGPVPRTAALACEEVFGPVLAAMPFEDEADAIALANGTDYGLLAAVWTENAGRLHRVAKAVNAGQGC